MKVVGKCEIYQNKGPKEIQGPRFDERLLPGGRDLTNLENLPQGFEGTLRLENMAGPCFG